MRPIATLAVWGACVGLSGCASLASADDWPEPRAGSGGASTSSTSVSSGGGGGAGGSTGSGGSDGGSGGVGGVSGGCTAVSPASMTYAAAVQGDTPQSYWRFDEASGATAADHVGPHEGIYAGAPTLGAAGAFEDNTAVELDGEDEAIIIGDDLNFMDADPFTIEAWICRASTSPAKDRRIVDKLELAPAKNGYALEIREPDGELSFQRWRANASDVVSTTLPNDGRYHYVVGVFNGAASFLYVDGVEMKMEPATHDLIGVDALVVIGNNEDGTNGFLGRIDEVAVYAQALTGMDVLLHYQAATQR